MEAYQARVKDEEAELSEKIAKLAVFIAGEPFDELDRAEQMRLGNQLSVMCQYANILRERIEGFKV